MLNQSYTRSELRSESRCTGPPLPETLRLLAPLAPTLETLNLRFNKISGACVEPDIHKKRIEKRIAMRAGELPLELIRMKAKGCTVKLDYNEPGFTLPSNIGELGDHDSRVAPDAGALT